MNYGLAEVEKQIHLPSSCALYLSMPSYSQRFLWFTHHHRRVHFELCLTIISFTMSRLIAEEEEMLSRALYRALHGIVDEVDV